MMLVLGSHLGPYMQSAVKRAFVHRFTGDHTPAWARQPMPNGSPYPVQFKDDTDWLANTYFWITVKGELAKRPSGCQSNPTWPFNPELRRNLEKAGFTVWQAV